MASFFNQEFKDDDCAELLAKIKQERNIIAKRIADLVEDKHNLPSSGPNSVEGHIKQLEGRQRRLRKLLDEYDTRGCGGGTGDARAYASAQECVKMVKARQAKQGDASGASSSAGMSPALGTALAIGGTALVAGGLMKGMMGKTVRRAGVATAAAVLLTQPARAATSASSRNATSHQRCWSQVHGANKQGMRWYRCKTCNMPVCYICKDQCHRGHSFEHMKGGLFGCRATCGCRTADCR